MSAQEPMVSSIDRPLPSRIGTPHDPYGHRGSRIGNAIGCSGRKLGTRYGPQQQRDRNRYGEAHSSCVEQAHDDRSSPPSERPVLLQPLELQEQHSTSQCAQFLNYGTPYL